MIQEDLRSDTDTRESIRKSDFIYSMEQWNWGNASSTIYEKVFPKGCGDTIMGSSYIGHVEPNYAVHGPPNDGFDENTTGNIIMDVEDSTQANAAKEIDKPMFEIGETTITPNADDSAQASAAKEIDKPMFEIGFIIFILVIQVVKWILFMLRGGANTLYIYGSCALGS